MARVKGSASYSGSFEVKAGMPFDAREIVPQKSDLTVASNFQYSYVGMRVAVQSEGKLYMLTAKPVTALANWKEIGGSSIPSGGTTGQVLSKKTNTDGDVEWKTVAITVDSALDSTSENPVQNKAVKVAIDGKVDTVSGKGLSTNDYTNADKTKLDGINLSNYIPTSQKGANSGVAELDANGKVPASQLPSYVDDVVTKASKSAFPNPGEDDKIYIAKDENASYRWDGTEYVSISSANGLTLGETSSTAYRGDRGKIAYDDSQTNKTNIGTLSSLTTTEKSNLVGAINEVEADLATKVDKVNGKGLSTNDFTDAYKQSIDSLDVDISNKQNKTLTTAQTIEGASVTTVEGAVGAVKTHTDRAVTDGNGAHGMKVDTSGTKDKLLYKSGNNWVEIPTSPEIQVSTLPTANATNNGKVLQYIGATTQTLTHNYFYECQSDGQGGYEWVETPVMYVEQVKVTEMPVASATELGNIYQYVGASQIGSYQKGYFYECVLDGSTYKWLGIRVQAGGGQTIQYDVMPEASVDVLGKIVQYTGVSVDNSYQNGFFYKCVYKNSAYSWEEKRVQSSDAIASITNAEIDAMWNS